MRRTLSSLPTRIISVLPLFILLCLPAYAQISPGSVGIMAEFGPALYLGEFNSLAQSSSFSPISGFDASFGLKYNAAENFTFIALLGFSGNSYEIDGLAREKYATSFFGPVGNTTYPGTSVRITDENRITANKYLIMGQSHFNPGSSFVPYFTLGIGYLTFSASNDLGEEIPTNMTGNYANGAVIMPIGFGAQYFLNDRFSMHAQGLFYINSTDYLDGYAYYTDFETGEFTPGRTGESATPSDYIASITIGASFTIYQPEPPSDDPTPIASDDVPERPVPQPTTQPTAQPQTPPVTRTPQPDADNDGLSDNDEIDRYLTDPNNADSDGDNLSDAEEVQRTNTSPNNPDTDADGLSDGSESLVHKTNPLDSDSDNDLLADGNEVRQFRTDPAKFDTDSDRAGDGLEITSTMTDPLNPDSDGDGVLDGVDDCPRVPGLKRLHGCPEGGGSTTPVDIVPMNPVPSDPVASKPPVTNPPATNPTPTRPAPSDPATAQSDYIIENNRVDFEGIYFQAGTDNFDFSQPETARNLQALLDYLQQCRNIGVVIEGHTSNEGSTDFNQALSEKRARRVRNWLYSNGVALRKILGTIGYGGRLPLVEEPAARSVSAAELERIRRQNRRITALVRRPCD